MSPPTLELVLGGARSGKSDWAVARARARGGEVLFVATAEPLDADMAARIENHRRTRPTTWHTLEEPLVVAHRLETLERRFDVVILDCLTMLVSNWLLACGPDDTTGPGAETVISRTAELCTALRGVGRHAIVISNEVGSGVVPEVALARRFRDHLGAANRVVAQQADVVNLLVAGLPLSIKERS